MDYLLPNSECSSGCESGWTLYLDNSFASPYKDCDFSDGKRMKVSQEIEEEEDLSMVSDASSGPPPPNFVEQDYYCCYYDEQPMIDSTTLRKNKKNITKENRPRKNKVHHSKSSSNSLLDDTASSPVFDIANNNFTMANNNHDSAEKVLDFSQGYSTTHLQGRSAYDQDQFGFFHSSVSRNYLQQENQWFSGRR
ncbi:hypothetical protein M9H77_20514 [Catharanthus roseus]|uniref:Uncharacterized protein n=1 Tax=Catharanthus roseus TaxID=4058 RepID=A0ACC0AKS3_CATRO|nr:hypothetical protein M9H77_20514 [Catharanthus roseus]